MSLPTLVVPARLASTRFPRKLLQDFMGVPLIVAVGKRLQQEVQEYPLVFAVDSQELADALTPHGFEVCLTDPNHQSGTDRIAEVCRKVQTTRVINVQGDEPLVRRDHIEMLTHLLDQETAPMVTLAIPFAHGGDSDNPNEVKVVINQQGRALYFSRTKIPYFRSDSGGSPPPYYRHLGLYGFTSDFLQRFSAFPPSPLEQSECLEQLRALDNGYDILVGITDHPTVGIDTPDDLERLRTSLS